MQLLQKGTLFLALIVGLNSSYAQNSKIEKNAIVKSKHSYVTKYPSYTGLIMAGYQGWFRAPKDGVMYPDENMIRIDMWPEVTEYEKTYPTGLKLADGNVANFFSSDDKSTVDLHF